MRPTVGRIVHFTVTDGTDPLAAIVTAVRRRDPKITDAAELDCEDNWVIDLTLFPTAGGGVVTQQWYGAPFSPDYKRGHWTWPPRT